MIRHLMIMIWNQRRSNVWLFLELALVVCLLWGLLDSFLVDEYTYRRPLGMDIERVYRINLGRVAESSPAFLPDSLREQTEGEDLLRLLELVERVPEVEATCVSVCGCPFLSRNWWSSLMRAEADSTDAGSGVIRMREVSSAYFDVFRMTDKQGRPLREAMEENAGPLVISEELEAILFDEESAVGRSLRWSMDDLRIMPVAAVSASMRDNPYKASEACAFIVRRTGQEVMKSANDHQVLQMECLVRLREEMESDRLDRLFGQMQEQATAGNLYISSLTPLTEMRTEALKSRMDNHKKKLALISFMMLNIFFGIVGTFWLRTQLRRGEIGLRMALGASRRTQKSFLFTEGLLLLALTLPIALAFLVNALALDWPDTVRLPYTGWRFLLTFGGAYFLMGAMICLGIWFPARKVERMDPAEALRYE